MTEIKIKKKSSKWPWILVVIGIIAIVVYFTYSNRDSYDYENAVNNQTVDADYNDDLNNKDYESAISYTDSTNIMNEFTESISDSTRIGMDSIYTEAAIKKLAKVVSMKADQYNLKTSKALEDLKLYSHKMENSKTYKDSLVSKNNLKTLSSDIVTVLESIQAKRFPSLQNEVFRLKQISNNLETSIAIEEQQDTIQSFFNKAEKVIKNMNS